MPRHAQLRTGAAAAPGAAAGYCAPSPLVSAALAFVSVENSL